MVRKGMERKGKETGRGGLDRIGLMIPLDY
jgi:hypothetical protein